MIVSHVKNSRVRMQYVRVGGVYYKRYIAIVYVHDENRTKLNL